ncbi:MAG TPA: hypothetical protein PKK99_00250 [Bacteroidia bacterium]|nr:hypothetical protein [Bacteroidia bacterium]
MILMEHTWLTSSGTTKKFLSRQLTHYLSRLLDRNKYEAVYEGGLDVFNSSSEEPDVVVYQKENGLQPLMAIEICNSADVDSLNRRVCQLMDRFRLREFFLYAMDEKRWYKHTANSNHFIPSSVSDSLAFTFDDPLTLFQVRN